MSNLYALDETLNFLNCNENSIFESLLESVNIELLNEKVDFKSIAKKIKTIIDNILRKIKEFIRKTKEKFSKYNSKKYEIIKKNAKSKSNDEEDYFKDDIDNSGYEYEESIIEYNGKKYYEKDCINLLNRIVDDIGFNHLFNIFHATCYDPNIEKVREGFENYKSYYSNFNKDIKGSKEKHRGLSEVEIDQYCENIKKVSKKEIEEIDWARSQIENMKKEIDNIEYFDDSEKKERFDIAIFIINRITDYFNIISKINTFNVLGTFDF